MGAGWLSHLWEVMDGSLVSFHTGGGGGALMLQVPENTAGLCFDSLHQHKGCSDLRRIEWVGRNLELLLQTPNPKVHPCTAPSSGASPTHFTPFPFPIHPRPPMLPPPPSRARAADTCVFVVLFARGGENTGESFGDSSRRNGLFALSTSRGSQGSLQPSILCLPPGSNVQ